jgi:hypothetical protein
MLKIDDELGTKEIRNPMQNLLAEIVYKRGGLKLLLLQIEADRNYFDVRCRYIIE